MKNTDQILLEEAYEKIIENYDSHMGKLFKLGDIVMLKHAALTKLTPIYKNHSPGDLFEVIGRDSGTSPMRRFKVKSLESGNIYGVHSYNIQHSNKPLEEPVIRVPKLMKGNVCSVHIDSKPGDRSVWCGKGEKGSKDFIHSILRPIAKSSNSSEAYILYQCETCGKQKVNVQALDDNVEELKKLPVREFKTKKYTI
jgi:hypothetical protein